MEQEINNNQTISYSMPTSDLVLTFNVDELTCIICLNICFKPIVIVCCDRLICAECVKTMIKHSSKCPYCNNVNINFDKPSKIIYRLFENLLFRCPNKDCKENIKYYFYFDHIYNSCNFNAKKDLAYCKTCHIIHNKKDIHDCKKVLTEEEKSNMCMLEKRINDLSLNETDSSKANLLPAGTINIPK